MRKLLNNFSIKDIIVVVLGIIVVFLLIKSCKSRNSYDYTSQIDSLTLANQKLDSIINKKNQVIYTQEAIIVDNKKALDDLTDTIFNLRTSHNRNTSTIAYLRTKLSAKIDSVSIPYRDTIAMKKFADSILLQCKEVIDYMEQSTITVPRDASIQTDSFSLSSTIKRDSLVINNLTIPNTQDVRIVERKNGLFKRKTIEIQILNSNPLIEMHSANSVIYKPKGKSFFGRILPIVVGAGIGILITK